MEKTTQEILRECIDEESIARGEEATTDEEWEELCKDPDWKSLLNTVESFAQKVTQKWISVKDSLPEQGNNVIMSYKFGVGEAKFINGNFCMPQDWDVIFPEVTGWMHLPERHIE